MVPKSSDSEGCGFGHRDFLDPFWIQSPFSELFGRSEGASVDSSLCSGSHLHACGGGDGAGDGVHTGGSEESRGVQGEVQSAKRCRLRRAREEVKVSFSRGHVSSQPTNPNKKAPQSQIFFFGALSHNFGGGFFFLFSFFLGEAKGKKE